MDEPQTTVDTIQPRLLGQQQTLDLISSDVTSNVSARTDYQEGLLQSVYKPLVKYAQLLVDHQQKLIDPVVDIVVSDIRGRIARQTAALSNVTSAVGNNPIGGVPVPAGGPSWRCGDAPPPIEPPWEWRKVLCPNGHWSGGYQQCLIGQPAAKCDGPTLMGNCQACNQPVKCPPGYHSENGLCIPDGPPPPPPPPDCPAGTTYNPLTGLCDPNNPPPPPPPPSCGPCCPPCIPPGGPLPCGPVAQIDTTVSALASNGYLAQNADVWSVPGKPAPHLGGPVNVYVGQVPSDPGSVQLIQATPLWAVLQSLHSSYPTTMVPRVFVPSGPAVDPTKPGAVCPVNPTCPTDGDGKGDKPENPDLTCRAKFFDGLTPWNPEDINFQDYVTDWINAFGAMGQDVFDSLLADTSIAWTGAAVVDALSKVPYLGKAISLLFGWVAGPSTVLSTVICVCRELRDSPTWPNGRILLGLYVTKMICNSLGELNTGVDIILKYTFSLDIDLTHLVRIVDHCIEAVGPIKLPALEIVGDQYLRGQISPEQAQSFVRLNGESWKFTQQQWFNEREQPTADEYVRLSWRINDTRGWLTTSLNQLGFATDDDITNFKISRVEPPSPAELLAFARREVFRSDKLGVEYMQEEFTFEAGLRDLFYIGGIQPIQFQVQDWSQLQAAEEIQGKLPIVFFEMGQGWFTFDTPLAHWIEHYQEISPEQSSQGLHKLRPNRVGRFRRFIAGHSAEEMQRVIPYADYEDDPERGGTWITPRPWTLYEHGRLLRQHEYNPQERGLLEVIGYDTLGLRQLKSMYVSGTFGEPQGRDGFAFDDDGQPRAIAEAEIELMERYQDMGKAPEDAELSAFDTAATWEDAANNKDVASQKKLICDAYQEGAIDADRATQLLKPLLKKDDKVSQFLGICDTQRILKLIRTAADMTGKAFRRGEATEQEARDMLNRYGVQSFRIDELISQWQLQMFGDSKQETAAQICTWRKNQLIGDSEAMGRLVRIGYTQERALKIMQSCYMGILAEDQKNQDKLRKAQEQADRKSRSGETESNIRNWIRAGIVSTDQAASMLAQKGWLPQDVEAWIAHSITLIEKDMKGQRKERQQYARTVSSAGEANLKKYLAMKIVSPAQAEQMLAAEGWTAEDITLWMKAYNPK